MTNKNQQNFVGKDFLASNTEIKSYLTAQSGFFYDAFLVEKRQSNYQLVSIWQSADLGYTLVLDDQLMCGEKDEHYYHEALIYPDLIMRESLVPNSTTRALIIGGGDGGSCEELLKYPKIEKIDFVEIDKVVVELSQKYLTSVHHNSFTHPKVSLRIEDGFSYLENTQEKYDLIYMDLNDPIGNNPVVRLYTPEFFNFMRSALNDKGLAVMQLGAANYNEGFEKGLNLASRIFPYAELYCAYCPSYHCLNYFMLLGDIDALAYHQKDKNKCAQEFFAKYDMATQILDADNFVGLFSIAKNVKNKIKKVGPV